VRRYDRSAGRELPPLKAHTRRGRRRGRFTRRKRAVTCGADKAVRIWNLMTGQNVGTFRGHTGKVNGVAISADGKYIVTGGEDKTVRVLDGQGKEIRRFTGHTDAVNGVAITADGKRAVRLRRQDRARLGDRQVVGENNSGLTVPMNRDRQAGIKKQGHRKRPGMKRLGRPRCGCIYIHGLRELPEDSARPDHFSRGSVAGTLRVPSGRHAERACYTQRRKPTATPATNG
jgi:hypothetical protein